MADRREPRLMLVTDRKRASYGLPELATRAFEGGVDIVQVREKDLSEDDLGQVVAAVVAEVGDPARVVVNSSVAIASELGVGIHLPESGPSPLDVRARIGARSLIGRSVHSAEAALTSAGANYLVAGHVFLTTSKPNLPPIGLDGLGRIVQATDLPVLAIGGISAANVPAVLATGAFGVAVISAINAAADPALAARLIRDQMTLERDRPMTTTTTTIEVTINGKSVTLDADTTISDFLAAKGYQERLVVVELNGEILSRSAFPETALTAGDRVEIVHFVGGG